MYFLSALVVGFRVEVKARILNVAFQDRQYFPVWKIYKTKFIYSGGFTYKLSRLKRNAAKSSRWGAPAKVHNILDTAKGLSYTSQFWGAAAMYPG